MSRIIAFAGMLAACAQGAQVPAPPAQPAVASANGRIVVAHDTLVADPLAAAGIAEPVQQAVLSTRLMGSVSAVLVHEGDRVAAGQLLVRIDAREVDARRSEAGAGLAEALAQQAEARRAAERYRALFADSAATRAQLDAVETGLARADAAVSRARAGAAQVEAMGTYAEVRAPFAGVVTRRMVDPGAFAAPGTPLVEVQDLTRLRIRVSVAPADAHGLLRGQPLDATVEGAPVLARVEGVVPGAGALRKITAIVEGADPAAAGGAATLALPRGRRRAIVLPGAALVHEGDLVGVRVRSAGGDALRWVRTGNVRGDLVEIQAGLLAGDSVIVASTPGER